MRYELRSILVHYPALFLPLAKLQLGRGRGEAIMRDTALVIEGYPRCGNTFAVTAFRQAQRRAIKIAHHLHAPAQIITAAKLRVPVLLLIREPVETVLSNLMLFQPPLISARQAFRDYVRFYSAILPYREAVVTATFQEVTTDFGAIIQRVNQKFGTVFDEFDHTESNVNACFQNIENAHVRQFGQVLEAFGARPSQERDRRKAKIRRQLRCELEGDQLAEFRAVAGNLYKVLTTTRDATTH